MAGVRRSLSRLSTKEARDVENVILEMRGRITRERITLKPSFKVGVESKPEIESKVRLSYSPTEPTLRAPNYWTTSSILVLRISEWST